MNLYTGQHRFYCGVDLHARTMFTHVLDHKGKTVFEQDLPADPAAFLEPSSRTARTWSSASSACSPGTGWPTCASGEASPSPSATPWP